MSAQQVIFQLGDLHYPEFAQEKTAVDTHDDKAPGTLDHYLGLPIPAAIKKALINEMKSNPQALIAICGDITTKGDRANFDAGLSYLAEIINDRSIQPPISPDRIHLVPGNHDVAFKGDAPFSDFDDVSRFNALSASASSAGFETIYTTTHRATKLSNPSGGALSVVSVNTCRGAGATRADAAERGITVGYVGSEADPPGDPGGGSPKHYEEVLDVPLLHPAELSALTSTWADADSTVLSVLLAHHGLLPQHTPRLNPYTEMVNGGQARKALANLHRPVLYLHGHIHEHVVEIVDTPRIGESSILSDRTVVIAAPELKDGFNRIVVDFSDQGRPLGITVETHRIRHGEQSVSKDPSAARVALTPGMVGDSARRSVLGLLAERRMANGRELVTRGAQEDPPLTDTEVRAAVDSLIWTGTIARVSANEPTFDESGYIL